jgi:Zn ribbon nucleic-acid-binding protein
MRRFWQSIKCFFGFHDWEFVIWKEVGGAAQRCVACGYITKN